MRSALTVFLFLAATQGRAIAGTPTAQFLNVPVGARAVGLGEAFTAAVDDASALYWNPAALTRISEKSMTATHSAYLASSFFDYAAYGQNLKEYGAFGAGFQYFNYGSIPETDNIGAQIGTFSPYDLAISLGYAYQFREARSVPALEGFSIGMAGKFVRSQIIKSASTFAADAGVLSPAFFDEHLRLGAVIGNVGGKMKFEQESEPLPLIVRLGGSYKLTERWLIALDGAAPRDNDAYAGLGTEYLLGVTDNADLAFRLGYNSRSRRLGGFTGLSLGFGVLLSSFSFDYAFVPLGGLGTEHQLSVGWRFGGTARREAYRPEPSRPRLEPSDAPINGAESPVPWIY